jgi:hypothetical protein
MFVFALLGCYASPIVFTDVSGQSIGPVFKGQAIEGELATNQGSEICHKNEDLIETSAEAWDNGAY